MDIKEQVKFLHENHIMSWHEHVWSVNTEYKELNVAHDDRQIEIMDTFGIDEIAVSMPVPEDKYCSPEKFIAANNLVYEAVKRHPGRYHGMIFVNPGYHDAMLAELERCKKLGFVGVKLYHQYHMDNPVQFALVEKCIELNLPILIHAAHPTDPDTKLRQPRVTGGDHMANIARRYPEATFLLAHIGGGGDWQWEIKAIADCPNVFADIGGSIHDRPLIEESVRYLGADRVLFATDGMWSSSISKILGADISDKDKKTILDSTRFSKFLGKAGK